MCWCPLFVIMEDEFAELIDAGILVETDAGFAVEPALLAASADWAKVEGWLVTLPATKRSRARSILLREDWSRLPNKAIRRMIN